MGGDSSGPAPFAFRSAILRNARTVWVQAHPDRPSSYAGALVFLDAEHYLDDLGAADIVARMQREGELSSGWLPVYVSHIDYPTRWRESFCNAALADCLSIELLPWLAAGFGVERRSSHAIVGLSLTGLAALHTALLYPGTWSSVLSQSGSFWWRRGWLIDEVARLPRYDGVACLSVGRQEVADTVDHGDGLVQTESQLSANRRMRDALAARECRLDYREHDGGHDLASFQRDLPDGLRCVS